MAAGGLSRPGPAGASAGEPAPQGPLHDAAPSPGPAGGRRRRLWELPASSHDWLLALSLPPPRLRALAERALGRVRRGPVRLQGSEADVLYALVHDLGQRNLLSEALDAALNAEHAAALRAVRALAGTEALRAHWAGVRESGEPPAVVAAAWALLTHPDGAGIENTLLFDARAAAFGWARSGWRREQAAAQALAAARAEAAACRERAQALAARLDAVHAAHDAERRAWADERAALRGELARRPSPPAPSADVRQPSADPLPPALAAAGPSRAGAAVTDGPVGRACVTAIAARATPATTLAVRPAVIPSATLTPAPAAAATDCAARACAPAAPALGGRRVLCVGGMPGARERYRALVEGAGARFAFHDGGVEQGVQRLEAQLGAADLVVCQAGCLNHEAYHRVKGHCRRAGKPCLFVQRPSLASFARTLGLDAAARAAGG